MTILLFQGINHNDYSFVLDAEAQTSDYLVYDDPISAAISLEYPNDWNFVESEGPGFKMTMFSSPVQNVNDSPKAIAMLMTAQIDPQTDLFDLSEIVVHEMRTGFGLQNFKEVESYETTLDKIPAQKMKFSGMYEPDTSIVGTTTWTIKDDRAYFFYFMSEPKELQ